MPEMTRNSPMAWPWPAPTPIAARKYQDHDQEDILVGERLPDVMSKTLWMKRPGSPLGAVDRPVAVENADSATPSEGRMPGTPSVRLAAAATSPSRS